ncbi:hypothetical protein N9F34_03260 [Alphaproteobacteria bacterium]|nr:hypothetical protein [Alphaproteobacteria bacterium]
MCGEKTKKDIEKKTKNINLSKGRFIVLEKLILPEINTTFNGEFKKCYSLVQDAIKNNIKERKDPLLGMDNLAQDHTDLSSYCDNKGLLNSAGSLLDRNHINVLTPENDNTNVTASTRTAE